MESPEVGELVQVETTGPALDGIVFDTPSAAKVVVAVIDPARGPVFRTVRSDAVRERTTAGAGDRALRLLIRRTPPPVHRASRDGSAGGHGRAGHNRGATHRTADR